MNTQQTTDTSTATPGSSVAEQAAEWLIDLRTQHFSQDDPNRDPAVRRAAFCKWITGSQAHLMIFLEMVELERRFNRLDASSLARIRDALGENSRGSSTAISPSVTANESDFKPSSSRRWIPFAAAASVILALLAAFLAHEGKGGVLYSTQRGEQHEFALDDGSTVKLNTDSQVEVRYSDRTRLVRLVRGEAFFTVKHDYSRQFIVLAGEARIWDRGTEFNVRQRANSVSVSVVSGKLEVGIASLLSRMFNTSPAWSLDGGLTLTAGQGAEVTSNRVVGVPGTSTEEATAWVDGRLVFRRTRLDEAVAEFNRYGAGQLIVIADESAQEMPVSGIFNSDRSQDFLTYVKTLPALTVSQEGNRWVIRSKH